MLGESLLLMTALGCSTCIHMVKLSADAGAHTEDPQHRGNEGARGTSRWVAVPRVPALDPAEGLAAGQLDEDTRAHLPLQRTLQLSTQGRRQSLAARVSGPGSVQMACTTGQLSSAREGLT